MRSSTHREKNTQKKESFMYALLWNVLKPIIKIFCSYSYTWNSLCLARFPSLSLTSSSLQNGTLFLQMVSIPRYPNLILFLWFTFRVLFQDSTVPDWTHFTQTLRRIELNLQTRGRTGKVSVWYHPSLYREGNGKKVRLQDHSQG